MVICLSLSALPSLHLFKLVPMLSSHEYDVVSNALLGFEECLIGGDEFFLLFGYNATLLKKLSNSFTSLKLRSGVCEGITLARV